MNKRFFCLRTAFIFLFSPATITVQAQESPAYRKNVISFNLTSLAVSEINMGYEHFLTSRRSIEFDGGLVYVNDFLKDQAKDWPNAVLFSEHGYAGRFHYKIFKRLENISKWRDYIAPGIVFKNLYYNDMPVLSEVKIDYIINDSIILTGKLMTDTIIYLKNNTVNYTENFLRKSKRIQFGIQFLWGKVYEINRMFALEFYYGAEINATIATRTDHSRYATYLPKSYSSYLHKTKNNIDDNQRRNQPVPDYIDKSFYLRPAILFGIKLRLRI